MRKWILCSLLERHDFVHMAALSDSSQKLGCKRCKKMFAINHSVRAILPWDYELEMFYRRFPHIPEVKG